MAFIAAILLASALGVVIEAHIAKTDAVLLAAVVAGKIASALSMCGRGPAGRRAGVRHVLGCRNRVILLKAAPGPALAIDRLALSIMTAIRAGGLYPVAGIIFTIIAVLPG